MPGRKLEGLIALRAKSQTERTADLKQHGGIFSQVKERSGKEENLLLTGVILANKENFFEACLALLGC